MQFLHETIKINDFFDNGFRKFIEKGGIKKRKIRMSRCAGNAQCAPRSLSGRGYRYELREAPGDPVPHRCGSEEAERHDRSPPPEYRVPSPEPAKHEPENPYRNSDRAMGPRSGPQTKAGSASQTPGLIRDSADRTGCNDRSAESRIKPGV